MKCLSLTEARNQLLRLAEEIEHDPSVVVEVRKRGRRVMALMSAELYESLVETLDLVCDPPMARELRRALRQIDRGKGMSWESAKRRLKLNP